MSPRGLLMRGKLETLLARREIGLLFIAFAMHHPRDRARFEAFAQRPVDMEYSEARRHMQLAANWERCVATLERLQNEAVRSQRPFVVPGLRRLIGAGWYSWSTGEARHRDSTYGATSPRCITK